MVARVFEDSLLRWYEHRLAPGDHTARGGLLDVIQRSSGDMRLNPHLHVVALERRGVVRVGPEALEVDDALANRDPVLAHLAAAAVTGLPVPSGPK